MLINIENACYGLFYNLQLNAGGPVISEKSRTLLGIVSNSRPCVFPRPNLFLSLQNYVPWIMQILGEGDSS